MKTLQTCSKLIALLGSAFALALALIFGVSFVSPAQAAEAVSGSGGSGFDIRNQINGAGNCNAGKDKYSGCVCQQDFVAKFTKELETAAGDKSGGQCLYGVRTALQRACNDGAEGAGWCLSAKDAGKCLRDLGFKENIGVMVPDKPKLGTVFVYKGGGTPHGHIEALTNKGYCSDFCKTEMITKRSLSHNLTAWYEPPEPGLGCKK